MLTPRRRSLLGLIACLCMGGWPVVVQAQADVVLDPSGQAAWSRVRAALTPQEQANAVRAFMGALATANGRRITPALDARDIASGRTVSLDDPALLQRPQAHELTVSLAGQFLTFRPLSRASVEPLLAR